MQLLIRQRLICSGAADAMETERLRAPAIVAIRLIAGSADLHKGRILRAESLKRHRTNTLVAICGPFPGFYRKPNCGSTCYIDGKYLELDASSGTIFLFPDTPQSIDLGSRNAGGVEAWRAGSPAGIAFCTPSSSRRRMGGRLPARIGPMAWYFYTPCRGR